MAIFFAADIDRFSDRVLERHGISCDFCEKSQGETGYSFVPSAASSSADASMASVSKPAAPSSSGASPA